MLEMKSPKKVGRPCGSTNLKYFKWRLIYLAPDSDSIHRGEYHSIAEICIKFPELKSQGLNNDMAWRLVGGKSTKIKNILLEKIRKPDIASRYTNNIEKQKAE